MMGMLGEAHALASVGIRSQDDDGSVSDGDLSKTHACLLRSILASSNEMGGSGEARTWLTSRHRKIWKGRRRRGAVTLNRSTEYGSWACGGFHVCDLCRANFASRRGCEKSKHRTSRLRDLGERVPDAAHALPRAWS
jgi:hypothetical protein